MKHITSEERHTIAYLFHQGKSRAQIAGELDRPRSTISREIKRNCDQRNGHYRHDLAQHKARQRAVNKPKRNALSEETKAYIRAKLELKYSPEQIVGEAKRHSIPCPSHETIYRHIWADKKAKGSLYQHLRNRGKRYRKRGAAKDRRGQIANKTPMSQRPSIVEKRQRLGDLEIDLMIGKDHQGALLTINDRVSGLVIIRRLISKNADGVTSATIESLMPFRDQIHTITSDNGKEFAGHQSIAAALKIDFYFAKPYHSWERGSNENLNGLIRQYVPKTSNILELQDSYIQHIESALNTRPRKRHGYHSPQEIHHLKLNQNNKQSVALAS
jgi:IS30 family transposase